MIETDILYAYVKKEDPLKSAAVKLIEDIAKGKHGEIGASRECLHELYYVSMEEGVDLDEVISRFGALTAIENLTFLETTRELDLVALTLMKQYGFSSIFDAYHAAAALERDEERTIVSTDNVYDRVAGLERRGPQDLI